MNLGRWQGTGSLRSVACATPLPPVENLTPDSDFTGFMHPKVEDAVRCAMDVQRGMAERNLDVTDEQRIEFRVGINLGDVIVESGDIFGDGVNVAARLEVLAEPGGICVSRVVRDQVRDRLDYTFEDLGEQRHDLPPYR